MAIVYRHIRLDKNEVFYIGIGKSEKRAYTKRSRNQHWKNIVSKTEYKVEIIFENLSWEDACEKEIELIKFYGRKDLGLGTLVNLTDGGDGSINVKMSIETKEKMSKSSKGKKKPEFTNEHIRNLSESHKGKKLSKEQKEKISKSLKGIKRGKFSEEHIKKLSESHKGQIPWNKKNKKRK
jgi:hypothetical protein